MIKVYDCSNSNERLLSRKLGGPVTNEFVGLLHKYANNFGFTFTKSIDNAEVIFTNDVFTSAALASGLPLVKRMDGVHWQKNLFDRNTPYVEACSQANAVIFITEYSRKSFETFYWNIYEHLNNPCVIRHWTEAQHIGKRRTTTVPARFCAIVTNWERPEKRLNELKNFAHMFSNEVEIHLIGTCTKDLPRNVIAYGYLDNDKYAFQEVLDSCDAFLNLTCKDAATKTVCTAINNRFPVLFANSGGVGEMVGQYGVGIAEKDNIELLDEVPRLEIDNIVAGYEEFKYQYRKLLWNINMLHMPATKLFNAIGSYFRVMRKVVEDR